MSWLCIFLAHRWRHITGKVWQCAWCKECSVGRDGDALPDLTGARYLAGYFHGVPDATRLTSESSMLSDRYKLSDVHARHPLSN